MSLRKFLESKGYAIDFEIPSVGVLFSILLIGRIATLKIDMNAEKIIIAAFRKRDTRPLELKSIIEDYEKNIAGTNFTVSITYI